MNVRALLLGFCLFGETLLLANASPLPDREKMGRRFPKDFLFGSALSGFQTEMGCPSIAPEICEDRNSDWHQFISHPDFLRNRFLFLSGDGPERGPGFYELFRQDIFNAGKKLKNNSIRVSIEWSRIFPRETFGITEFTDLRRHASQEGLRFYHQLFEEMKKQGLTPLVTLNHYTLPLWIHDAIGCHRSLKTCTRKGWADPAMIVPEIAKYAGFAAREFGREVDLWATLNEPVAAVVLPGYLIPSQIRSNPPGLHFHISDAKRATLAMMEAHARMYDAVRAADRWDANADGKTAEIGLVNVYSPVFAEGRADENSRANLDYLLNHLFLRAVIDGELDENWDGTTVPRPDLGNRMDFIGVNYYMAITVREAFVPVLSSVSSLLTLDPILSRMFGDRPQGIYEVARDLARYKRPIIITETGTDASMHPESVEDWLHSTLAWTRQAIADGYDIRGYFYWTLFDNYEWNLGADWRMGLFEIDPGDPFKTRHPRSAVAAYRNVCESRRVPAEQLTILFQP